MKFSSDLVIHNVLFVPKFSLNLISASKFCYALRCTILVDDSACLIHEKQSKKMIDSTERFEVLSNLNLKQKDVHVLNVGSVNLLNNVLCHFILGHLSFSKCLLCIQNCAMKEVIVGSL